MIKHFAVALCMALPAAAQAEVRLPEVAGAPFTLAQVSPDPVRGEIVFVLQSRSEELLVNPGVRGKVFANGVRKGGFVYVFETTLKPGESQTLRRGSSTLPIHDDDLVLVVPSQVSVRAAAARSGRVWSVHEQHYRALGPHTADGVLTGAPRPDAAAPAPNLMGDCCERCLSDAGLSCGNNYFAAGNSCRGRCITGYSCTNERGGPEGGTTCDCVFSCKNSDQCC